MITNSPIIQLFMVVLAVAILLLYIQPTIEAIRVTQDQTVVYQSELDRVTEVNDMLQRHINTINTLPLSDVQALERYIPTTIDEIAVMRDLRLLVNEVGVTLTALKYEGPEELSAGEEMEEAGSTPSAVLVPLVFSLGVQASYSDLKNLLRALEINNYQLTVINADIAPNEDGLLTVTLDLVAYALEAPGSATMVTQ